MVAKKESESQRTTVQKKSEARGRRYANVSTRPRGSVFEACLNLSVQEVVGASLHGMTLRSCEIDVRTGGTYPWCSVTTCEHDGVLLEVPRSGA